MTTQNDYANEQPVVDIPEVDTFNDVGIVDITDAQVEVDESPPAPYFAPEATPEPPMAAPLLQYAILRWISLPSKTTLYSSK